MNTFFFLIPSLFPVMIIGLSLMLLKMRDGKIDAANLSTTKWLLGAFAAAMVWFCLFKDKQTILECRKDAMICSYYRSTIADPELRLSRSFGIKDVQDIELKTEKRRSGKYSTKTVYRIVFVTPTAREEFPVAIDFKERAVEEVGKINRFLKSNRESYVFFEGHPEINGFERGMIFSAVLTTLAFAFWCFFDRRKKAAKEI